MRVNLLRSRVKCFNPYSIQKRNSGYTVLSTIRAIVKIEPLYFGCREQFMFLVIKLSKLVKVQLERLLMFQELGLVEFTEAVPHKSS